MTVHETAVPVESKPAPAQTRKAEMIAARVLELTTRVTTWMGAVSGFVLLLLAFFMTVDVLGRRFGGPFSGATDEIASYAMAFSATWALAYTLSSGRHIRIDLCLPWLPPRVRRVVDYAGVALLGVFAGLLAFSSWTLALDSQELESRSMVLGIPLMIPQAVVATGFTLLVVQALVLLTMAPFRELGAVTGGDSDDDLQGI